MKTEDIDKKIGMPDVDAEWARFEQEVIGKEPKRNRRSIYSWIGGLGIAACLLLFFLINIGDEPQPETPVVAEQAEPQPVQQSAAAEVKEIQKEPIVHIVNTPQPKKTPRKELASANHAFESVDQALQGQIAGLDVVPNPSNLGKGVTMRLRGMTTIDDSIQPLVVLNGKILEIPDSVKIGNYDTEEQFSSLLGVKPEDIKSIVVIKDSKATAKWGEKGAGGVIEISTNTNGKTKKVPETKPISEDEQPLLAHSDSEDTGHGPSLPQSLLNLSEDELQGQIAGLPPITDIRKVKKNFRRPPNKQGMDTILIVVNGKEDKKFLKFYRKMPFWSYDFIHEYFYDNNQIYLRTNRTEGDDAKKYAHLFNGRDIRKVIDYQTFPFTPVRQLTPEELKARRLAYLLRCYQEGNKSPELRGINTPELFDTPTEERIFGLLPNKCHGVRPTEWFGHVSHDSRGTYIPLHRLVYFQAQDEIWERDGEWLGMENDELFNAIRDELKKAAAKAPSSLIERTDSIVKIAFIFGGKVKKGAPHESNIRNKILYKMVKEISTFEFLPDEDAPSYWTAEIYYSTQFPRHMDVQLRSVDKLYASDCPDILNIHYKRLTGVVQDEEGKPIAHAIIDYRERPYFSNGVPADSLGRFELMLPNHIDTIRANWIGYQTQKIHVLPTDSVLTIRLKEIDWKGLRESFKKSKK
ncbi:MAG: TonB-dependent receptor plug domain-containing protein [Bacteroidaceae bacterium]|nr:TonB-dependent receptor plug domain-containing protein [Bacteroidaceae bacterium]